MDCLKKKRKITNKKPVWSDPNEPEEEIEQIEIEDRTAKSLDDSDLSSDDDEIHGGDVRSKNIKLETSVLKYSHQPHINTERAYKGRVQLIKFHPKSRVALVGLSKGQVDLFEVDGERNRYVQNITIPRTNSPYCDFTNNCDSIMITSQRYGGTFYIYDMMSNQVQPHKLRVGKRVQPIADFIVHENQIACRNEGSSEINILNGKTYEVESSIKLNENAKVVRFTSKGDILIAGENASTYIWDLRNTSICKNKFIDEGTVHIQSLDLSESSQQIAIGTDTGMVNIYELSSCLENRYPKPFKTLANLKQNVDILKYNNTGELLIMGSSEQDTGIRMVHSHSGTVYRNFPVKGKVYNHLLCADFSPLCGYLGLGSSGGRAHLIRIPYYKCY